MSMGTTFEDNFHLKLVPKNSAVTETLAGAGPGIFLASGKSLTDQLEVEAIKTGVVSEETRLVSMVSNFVSSSLTTRQNKLECL